MMQAIQKSSDIATLVRQLAQQNRAALARLLSLAATGHDNQSLASALNNVPQTGTSIVALTGSAGVGKSSLLGAVAAHLARRGERVGVLACDPQSPVTGGALLGDRLRIAAPASSEKIYIRSLAIPSGQQGIAQHIDLMLNIMDRCGFDHLFVETVGAGQGDVAVRNIADIVVLVVQPHSGDELQWQKAGILEIADVVVVNKADLPGAEQTVADVTQHLQSSAGPTIPIVRTSIARSEGIEELCHVIERKMSERN